MKEAVQEGAVLKEKNAEIFIDGKNAVPVPNIDQFKRHTGSALHSVFVSAGRTEAAVASKRDKFKLSAVRTTVHGAAKGGIATVDHFIHVFYHRLTWM